MQENEEQYTNGNDDDDDDGDDASDDTDDDTVEFYAELRKVKQEMFGGRLPHDQVAASAAAAQHDFLQAMEQVGKEFHDTKQKYGSDAAIELMMEQLQQQHDDTDSDVDATGNEQQEEEEENERLQ